MFIWQYFFRTTSNHSVVETSKATAGKSASPPLYGINIEKAAEIPSECRKLAEILSKEPLFKGKGFRVPMCTAISVKSYGDARICEIFTKNAKQILEKSTAWEIFVFGNYGSYLYDKNNRWLEDGLGLEFNDEVKRCSLEDLEKAYSEVFNKMISGWVRDCTEIEGGEEFLVFYKARKDSLCEEDCLIRFIAHKFFKECEHIVGTSFDKDKLELRIKKSTLNAVMDKFGFDL